MLVKEIMVRDVKTTGLDSTIQEAAQLMSEHSIGCLIVVENDKLEGIITERDIVRRVVSENRIPSETKVRTAMSQEVVLIRPDATVEEAAEAMTAHKVKKLPVVENNQLVGIVTTADVTASQPKLVEQLSAIFLIPKKKKLMGG